MSREFRKWAAQAKKVQRAITSHDHAWLADNTDYTCCPECGERLHWKLKAEPKGGGD